MARTKHTYQIPSVSFTKEQQRNAIQSMACRKWHKEIAANICEALCIAMRIRGGGAKFRIAEGSDDHVHLHDAMEICEMFQVNGKG